MGEADQSAAGPTPGLRLRVAVSSDRVVPGRVVELEADWLGVARQLSLRDEGAGEDVPADGIFVGEWRGERPSLLPIRAAVRDPGVAEAKLVWSGVFRPLGAEDQLHLRLIEGPDGLSAASTLATPLGQRADAREASWTAAGFGWSLFVLGVCAALAALPRGRA